mmetsp:Transcript_59328/g.171943  ORF Transcript_59328/g.171943 Transcript_59328/m.171943 type:complete len:164 (+) Transcript_59328:2053-2544(+)
MMPDDACAGFSAGRRSTTDIGSGSPRGRTMAPWPSLHASASGRATARRRRPVAPGHDCRTWLLGRAALCGSRRRAEARNFERLLPPAAELLGKQGGGGAADGLSNSHEEHLAASGGGTTPSPLRAPIPVEPSPGDDGERSGGRPTDVNFTPKNDGFAKTGFRY